MCTRDGLKEELNHLSSVFQANGYPHAVTSGVLNKKCSLLTHVKAFTPPEEQKCVVFRVPCECGSVYVGETGRQMKTRIEEHKRAVMKADPTNAIAEHLWNTGHKIQWDETTSNDHDGDWFRRRIKEALHVRSSNTINSDPGLSLNPCCTASRTAPLHQ